MKRTSIYRILAVLVTATILFAACTKEGSDVRLAAKVATTLVSGIKSDSATVVGYVIAEGDGFTEKGICYNTATAPTITNNKVICTSQTTTATFTAIIKGLHYATKYYARAYATGTTGTIYGEEFSFTTLSVVPQQLTTTAVSLITGNTAASGGTIVDDGGEAITAKGICWSTNHNPTTASTKTSDGTGIATFTSSLTNLLGKTTYYVRAYATNSVGTAYGPEVSFTTLVAFPIVTTAATVTAITKVSAISGGEVVHDGGATAVRGLVWGTATNPTIANNVIAGGTGAGAFVSNLTGLATYTKYYVRAFATNSAGTAYGAEVSFTTVANTRTWYIPGDYVAASYPGSTYGDWSPGQSPQVKSILSAPDNVEGYVYMANPSNNWKFATQPNWDGPNYANNDASGVITPGILHSDAKDNINSPKGYYKLNVDASVNPMTFTAVATTWGITGNATLGSWGANTPMSYDPTTKLWTAHATLSKQTPPNDGLKFWANSGWDINYGDTGADGSLEPGGTNIGVAVAGDYEIVLDLSQPLAYTYSMTRWGLIGSATPGSWNTDTPMSWDAVNNVWTVTVSLVSGNGANAFKFRANSGWDLNFGGTGSGDGTADNYSNATTAPLSAGGKNIGVPGNVDGTYKVTLNIKTLKATVTLVP